METYVTVEDRNEKIGPVMCNIVWSKYNQIPLFYHLKQCKKNWCDKSENIKLNSLPILAHYTIFLEIRILAVY